MVFMTGLETLFAASFVEGMLFESFMTFAYLVGSNMNLMNDNASLTFGLDALTDSAAPA